MKAAISISGGPLLQDVQSAMKFLNRLVAFVWLGFEKPVSRTAMKGALWVRAARIAVSLVNKDLIEKMGRTEIEYFANNLVIRARRI